MPGLFLVEMDAALPAMQAQVKAARGRALEEGARRLGRAQPAGERRKVPPPIVPEWAATLSATHEIWYVGGVIGCGKCWV